MIQLPTIADDLLHKLYSLKKQIFVILVEYPGYSVKYRATALGHVIVCT